jgi:D-alanyl-D-alanine carboxypeptidase (penicillin-binding protein 5/6)
MAKIPHLFFTAILLLANIGFHAELYADSIDPPDIDASGYLLVDFQSGDALVEKNAHQRIEPASITKIMTAYVIYQELEQGNISLDDDVLISQKAWEMKGSRMFVKLGKKVKLHDMLLGLIVQSGNDAAVAIAEHVAGSEEAFVARMNLVAKELNLENTHYENVTGWPSPNHYTTASDIAYLSKRLIVEYPEHYKMYSQKEYTYNKINQRNRNQLLWKDKSVDGIKTGHTESAGYCLAASAKRHDMRLISVVLGTKSSEERTAYTRQLLEFGFRFYETHLLYKAGSVLTEARVWKGNKNQVPLGTIKDLYVTIQKNQYQNLKGVMEIDTGIDAPIKRGDVLGKIALTYKGKVVREAPLIAMQNVGEGGYWDRVIDSVKKFFD